MAQLVVEVTEKGIKKVGTELAKLGKTGTSTEKSLDKTGKTSNNLSVSMVGLAKTTAGVAAGMIAVSAAVTATTIAIAAQVVATDNLRRVSGLSIDQFEASAFAAQQYGLDVKDLSDSFKDATERIGDFIATGGGPLQDFADVMGYTADETLAFAKEVEGLSGKDVLVRMVSELESAGASTETMSFALEGMASNLTFILPLLTNNAKEFDRLSQAMDAVTVPLDQEDIDTFRGLNEAVGLVTGAMGSLLNEAVLPLVQPMTDLAEATAFFIASLNEGTEAQLSSDLVDLTERSRELKESIEANETAWGRLGNVATFESTDNDVLIKELDEVNAKIESTRKRLSNIRIGVTTDDFVGPTQPSVTVDDNALSEEEKKKLEILKESLKTQRELIESEYAKNLELTRNDAEARLNVESKYNEDIADIRKAEIEASRDLKQEAIDADVEALRVSLLSEQDLRLENALNNAELIAQSTLAEEEQDAMLRELWGSYYDDIADVSRTAAEKRAADAKMAADEEAKQNKRAIDGWDNLTQDLKSTLGEQNALYKASATVNATIKSYEAANSAYAALAGVPLIGPALGAAAAGVAIASGLANVAAINSSRAQGGSVGRGDVVEVGERGRELFVPETNGSIISANMLNNAGGGGGGNVYITNNTPSKVEATQDDEGNTYVKIEELDQMVGAALSNPNSESYQGLSSVVSLQRN